MKTKKTPEEADPAEVVEAPKDTRVAKIKVLVDKTPAKNFTFAKNAIVERVPFAHAEFLVSQNQAQILEVSAS